MSDIKEQLIRLGSKKPGLRKHLRPLIAEIDKAARLVSDVDQSRARGKKLMHNAARHMAYQVMDNDPFNDRSKTIQVIDTQNRWTDANVAEHTYYRSREEMLRQVLENLTSEEGGYAYEGEDYAMGRKWDALSERMERARVKIKPAPKGWNVTISY